MRSFQCPAPEVIAGHLVRTLATTDGLNSFLESAVPALAESFGADRAMLVDFRETTGRFVLLHWFGYASSSRFDLQRRVAQFELQKTLTQKEPFFDTVDSKRLYVPLYFVSALEAVMVFEAESPMELTAPRCEIAQMISKFIGMMMSSNRLPFNQQGLVDLNDLERARQIQLTYLPAGDLEADRYELYGYNQSSAFVGGDYFDYFRQREKSIQCVLADASGHGLSAALIMSAFRGMLRADIDEWPDCGDLFTALNRAVHTGTTTVQYLTSVFLDFDEHENRLKYTNAGHFEPTLVRADAAIERLAGGGPPLGMFGNARYPTVDAGVRGGDVLVLFTDGFTDLRNASDEFFGEQRILDIVREQRTRPLKEIGSVLLNEGATFSASEQPEDDLTLFLMRFH